jgi:hypothetical protein
LLEGLDDVDGLELDESELEAEAVDEESLAAAGSLGVDDELLLLPERLSVL